MSDTKSPDTVGTLRLYMKSGNVICLSRVTAIEWKSGALKQMSLTQGGPPGGERMIMATLDLEQVEAMTWEDPVP